MYNYSSFISDVFIFCCQQHTRCVTLGTSSQDILDLFRTGFRGTVEEMSGFQLYLGVKIDETKALFLNVFDDDAGSTAANTAASDFFASSDLNGKASVEKYSGMIGNMTSLLLLLFFPPVLPLSFCTFLYFFLFVSSIF